MLKSPLAGVALLLALVIPASACAQSAGNPHQRGPAPTVASLRAASGPFATASMNVANAATPGFGSATVTYPTTRTAGTFGAVAIVPGFTAPEVSIAWLRPRIASQGFVVISFNTNSILEQPAARGNELLAALDWLTRSSSLRDRIDANRLAVMGHSMGGGGTLEAAKDRSTLKAAVALTPWDLDGSWPQIRTPTLIVGAQLDTIAPPALFATRFYNGLPRTLDKAYLALTGATHFAPNIPNTTIAAESIAWLKRFVDDDTRYTPFLCPNPSGATAGSVARYDSTCPF